MESVIKGRILLLGDNIDTDQICPGRFLELTDPEEIASHCLAGISENIAENFRQGDIVIAGKNFGCGSSREHAVIALIHKGASAIVADSFARIFYRNGINLGLPLIVSAGASSIFSLGDKAEIDLRRGLIINCTNGKTILCDSFSDKTLEILSAGGIKPLIRKKLGRNSCYQLSHTALEHRY